MRVREVPRRSHVRDCRENLRLNRIDVLQQGYVSPTPRTDPLLGGEQYLFPRHMMRAMTKPIQILRIISIKVSGWITSKGSFTAPHHWFAAEEGSHALHRLCHVVSDSLQGLLLRADVLSACTAPQMDITANTIRQAARILDSTLTGPSTC